MDWSPSSNWPQVCEPLTPDDSNASPRTAEATGGINASGDRGQQHTVVVIHRLTTGPGTNTWEVWYHGGDNPAEVRIGHESFEHERVARLYARELMLVFHADRLIEEA